jgi:hypothetical protein
MCGLSPVTAQDAASYAVMIEAQVQSNPPVIALEWLTSGQGVISYTVQRKNKEQSSWGSVQTLPGTATAFVDSNVQPGGVYEYQVTGTMGNGDRAFGYICVGVNAPLIDNRGTVVLVVATNSTVGLANELARLESDLVGDGWVVARRDVSSSDTPASVRNQIISEYQADRPNVKAVFLLGHVPILRSGNLDYDGHGSRPMPADAFYGDIDGNWNSSPGFLPSDVELMVGRVDMFDMPGAGASSAWPSETELLRRYLNKDHQWRHARINVPRRALIGDRRGVEEGYATAASGFRNFASLVGPENLVLANVADSAPTGQRWISLAAAQPFLLAYGGGGGGPTMISHMGTRGVYRDLWSIDVVGQDAKTVFNLFFGSWFGEWDSSDNFLRSLLATPTMGLASALAGQPHWYIHSMGVGEPIGYGTRLSMNNNTLYKNQINDMTRAVYVGLMGDPTLRLHPVVPPAKLGDPENAAAPLLRWSASPDATLGYHVYRASNPRGPFSRLTTAPLQGTSYVDASPSGGASTFMVRALKLEVTPSGSYTNASQGIFFAFSSTPPEPPPGTSNALFSNRAQVSGTEVAVSGSNVGAGKEPGEPNHAGNVGGASAWWTWTAPESGVYAVSTAGSSFDTVLAVYTGSSVANLILVAANDDAGGSSTSGLTFNASAGTTYQIAVDGYNGETGTIQLAIYLVPPRFNPINGNFNGLFYPENPTHADSGFLSLQTTAKGNFSGVIFVAGKRYPISGRFSDEGAWSGTVNRNGLSPVGVVLQADMANPDLVTGVISVNGKEANLVTDRKVYHATQNRAPQAGTYTLVLSGSDNSSVAPGGTGYAKVVVKPGGAVNLVGVLGDGTAVSQAVPLSGSGSWPLYLRLYSAQGSVLGWLSVDQQAADDISGSTVWFKSPMDAAKTYHSGFAMESEAVGSVYRFEKGVPVLDFAEGQVRVENGGVSEPVINRVLLDEKSRVSNLDDSKAAITINKNNGLFKGRVMNPDTGKYIQLRGVVLQSRNHGSGFFIGDTQTGPVYLGP